MSLVVREAVKEDAGRIVGLYDVFYNTEWFNMYKNSDLSEFADTQRAQKIDVKNYAKWLNKIKKSKDEQVFVLEDKSNKLVVGFIVGLVRDRKHKWKVTGHLDDLYVEKSYRGKGGGRKLINKMLAWFKKTGCKFSTLGVDLLNPKAIKLYESYGYIKTNYKMTKKL